MKQREVIPLKQGLDFKLTLPGSKSITNRAFLCAALAQGKSKLYGALESDDTKVMMTALKQVGVKFNQADEYLEVAGVGGRFKGGDFEFDLHNAGTATRFLTAAMCVREGQTIITGDNRMQERPIGDLVNGLRQLGVEIEYLENEGFPPIKITGSRKQETGNGQYLIRMKGDKSSQYFSAILMMAPLLDKPLNLEVEGDLVSKPYIDITIAVMKDFGVEVKNNHYQSFEIEPQTYQATDYYIEGDASAASYWTTMNFLHGGYLEFENLNTKESIQGDAKFQESLINLVRSQKSEVRSQQINMEDMPDVAMTMAVVAPFFEGRTEITGLSTLRIKETDRLAALENELSKLGVKVSTTEDSIAVSGQRSAVSGQRLVIETYHDHRMAMCFAVMGTKIPGVIIDNPSCVDKTYPEFWNDLERMYVAKKVELGNKNLVLTGMRCSGKTYYGQKIAHLLGRKFVDLDIEIEKSENLKISQIVKQKGWDYFRNIEQNICSKYSDKTNLVIATGGGVVLNENNMKALKNNGVNVFIFADVSALVSHIKKQSGDRPSLTGRGIDEELEQIWQERRDLYLKYADHVWDDTSGQILEESLEEIFVSL